MCPGLLRNNVYSALCERQMFGNLHYIGVGFNSLKAYVIIQCCKESLLNIILDYTRIVFQV